MAATDARAHGRRHKSAPVCLVTARSVRRSCVLVASALLMAVAGFAATSSAPPAGAQVPGSGSGITVVSSSRLDARLLDVTVRSTAVNRDLGVRVLLPDGYDASPTARYPVLYLLHGGYGNHRDWTDAGDARSITAGRPVIVVMPDGGQGGWYSNWSNFGAGGSPAWSTFHVDQLVPWVDANFRTVAGRSGRAVAGLSMGGFGAVSYAARYPRVFGAAAAFSGAVDIQNPAVAALIAVSPVIDGGAPGAIYGVAPFDQPGLQAHNPVALAADLRNTYVALYTGNGQPGPLDPPSPSPDVQEPIVRDGNWVLHNRLVGLGITHRFVDYGNGTHSWPYWRRSLAAELPSLLAALSGTQHGVNVVADGGFEWGGLGAWRCVRSCGVDTGLGLSRTGAGNGWVRNTSGWNDLHQTVGVTPNTPYRLTAWVRTAATNVDIGFLGVRTTSGTVIGERSFTRLDGYTQLTVDVTTGSQTQVDVFAGMWTNRGDVWMRVDDVSLVRRSTSATLPAPP